MFAFLFPPLLLSKRKATLTCPRVVSERSDVLPELLGFLFGLLCLFVRTFCVTVFLFSALNHQKRKAGACWQNTEKLNFSVSWVM